MARTEVTPQPKPSYYNSDGTMVNWVDLNDDGDGYSITFKGPVDLIFWNSSLTEAGEVTISSVASPALGNRTGDYVKNLGSGEMVRWIVPQVGFDNSGKLFFEVAGNAADDIKLSAFYVQ
jgi:hypothetical protein